jgi:hypothetical protein
LVVDSVLQTSFSFFVRPIYFWWVSSLAMTYLNYSIALEHLQRHPPFFISETHPQLIEPTFPTVKLCPN